MDATTLRRLVLVLGLLSTSACASIGQPFAPAERASDVAHGRDLAAEHCSVCHAISASGDSPAEAAPAFREIHDRFDGVGLNAVLSQGISHSRPAMPWFNFNDQDARALAAYLRSVQQSAKHDRQRG